MRKASGWIVIDGQEVAETMNCCHCGFAFEVRRGSGTDRGFCMNCNKVTCGNHACDPCVPFERQLDLMEGRAPKKANELDWVAQYLKKIEPPKETPYKILTP